MPLNLQNLLNVLLQGEQTIIPLVVKNPKSQAIAGVILAAEPEIATLIESLFPPKQPTTTTETTAAK